MSDYAISEAEFRELYQRLRRESAWVPTDRRGALNNISMSDVVAAAANVTVGRTVSLAAPLQGPAVDNPEPAVHEMAHSDQGSARASGLTFAADHLALNIHGNADSHMDALNHVLFDGMLYNGLGDATDAASRAAELSIDIAGQGIAGRGLLLDIPKLRGVPWLEPGDHVTADDLLAAESAQADQISQGDLLFIRVGHRARRRSVGPWDAAEERAGLHPTALELLAERRIGVLGSDGNNDTAPSAVEGVDFPVHVLAINAMGLHLLDYLDFEGLVEISDDLRCCSFLCVLAPLRLPAGTGSPVNPIAIF
ncbi:MAG TPA: cyclase family protein [Trebonia sp.]|jgi:kynurenine formamidase|nr:cyclase family protein [Trebonia sp.]